MSSFWTLDDGTSAVSNEKEFSAGGGDFEVIPKGTSVLVVIEDATWKQGYQVTEEFVNLKVRVLKPEGYANRILFFKLWVDELDPGVQTNGVFDGVKARAKRDKHKKMLMAIDANAKGRLAKMATRMDSDQLSVALLGGQFVATLGVWDKTGEDGKTVPGGNWLMTAKPKSAEITDAAKPKPKPAMTMAHQPAFDDEDDSDVPF